MQLGSQLGIGLGSKWKLWFVLQSYNGRGLANGRKADDVSSIVLVTKAGAYFKSDAVLKITEVLTSFSLLPLKPAATMGRILVPKSMRDVIYDCTADNR